jgi:diguanylate cyclase (GGDEF)-like protein
VSTRTTARSAAQIAEMEEISQQWSDVYLRISIEYEQLVDFLRADDEAGRKPLVSSIGSAEEILRWLNAHGSALDTQHARALQNTYGGYSYTLRDLVDADSRHDRAQVDLDAKQAALSASALRKQASVNVARKGLEMGVALRKSQDRSHKLLLGVEIISGLDLVLVTLCALVLLTYQRRTEWQAAQSRHRATHDALTGAANRELLGERVDAAIAASARSGSKVGLLLLDLNRFKEVNDTLGHHAGDLLLQEVATRLRAGARQSDTVARLGGDEFALLLPETDGPTAQTLLTRLRATLLAAMEQNGWKVGFSMGAATWVVAPATVDQLMARADELMYEAKRTAKGSIRLAVVGAGAPAAPATTPQPGPYHGA